jgi:glycosyltransferase involved in cell wall biosynthesis
VPRSCIAVCVCTRDRADALARCLEAIERSSLAPAQVIASDDGDKDTASATAAVCERFRAVEYRAGPRRGLAANRNACLDALAGAVDTVVFVDDDAEVSPEFLAAGSALLERSGPRTIVTGAERHSGSLHELKNCSFFGYQELPVRAGAEHRTICINATLFPRELFDVVRFDERLRYGYEEADIAAQARAADYRIVYDPALVNEHRPSPAGREGYPQLALTSRLYGTYKRYRWLERNQFRATAFALLAPLHIVGATIRRGRASDLSWTLRSIRTAVAYALDEERTRRRRG